MRKYYYYLNAFIAGVLATVIPHQGMLFLLHAINLTPRTPYSWTPTQPFGVPSILSLSFWGGLWGIVYILIRNKFLSSRNQWLFGLLFGLLLVTSVNLFIVFPLQGKAFAGGGKPSVMITSGLVNAAWGLGVTLWLHRYPSKKS